MTNTTIFRTIALAAGLTIIFSTGTGCYSKKNTTPPGVDIPFAGVEIGWGDRRTKEHLGGPDDVAKVYRGTGILGAVTVVLVFVWDLPLWLNKTDRVIVYYYENQGKIIFDRDWRVRQVLYDPTEDGYH